ncbi:MAG: hypothetical protein IKQ29_01615 [Bacilli bacterium]|nr:hypothetical protein [Bacilli bacterium]
MKKVLLIVAILLILSTLSVLIYYKYYSKKDNVSNLDLVDINNGEDDLTNVTYMPLYKEEILNGADPELDDNMIPVIYEDGSWKKADIYSEWYSYEKYNWANVVYVVNSKLDYYINSDSGTIINMNDILGFFVWIPRYEYKLFNVNNQLVAEQLIDIKFVSTEEEKKRDVKNGNYYTHPAFTAVADDGDYELNGFWIAKFEPSLSKNNVVNILPNKFPIISVNMAKMWEYATSVKSSYDMNIDSRNLTNMEWGAVAYLTQSKYGKVSNTRYSEKDRLVFNNNALGTGETFNKLTTGCSSGKTAAYAASSCTYQYDVDYYGTGASSTGTIYGVYDLVGGAWDCVMGIVSNYPIRDNLGGYKGKLPANKRYYSFVKVGNNMYDRSRGLLGDATREVLSNKYTYSNGYARSWNGDYAYLANTSWPWVKRGGAAGCGELSGIFGYGITDAISRNDKSFRVVLSKK